MSETTSSSEPTTGPIDPVVPAPTPPPVVVREQSRLTQIAAWVGIVAGVVFVIAVIFFSGFVLGAHAGNGHGGHHRGGPGMSMHHEGAPPMYRGPMMRPGQGFVVPGGPGIQVPQPPESPAPTTSTAPTPPR